MKVSKHNKINLILGLSFALLLAVCADGQPFAYVSNVSGNVVTVINAATASVVTSIPVPAGPTGLAVTPDGSSVYVASQGANSVSVINAASNSVVNTIGVGSTPVALAISPTSAQIYVVNQASNSISVIDTASQAVIANIQVGSRPVAAAFSPDGTRAFVTNLFSGNISVIDTNARAVINTFAAGSGPGGLAVAPSGQCVYVANQYSSTVTVHDLFGNLLSTIGGFVSPNSIAVTPNGGRVFVTNGNGNSVGVIDAGANSLLGTIAAGSLPTSIAISPDGTRAYVTNEFSFTVSVIDTNASTLVNTIQRVGVYPIAVAMSPPATNPLPTAALSTVSVSPSVLTSGQSATLTVGLNAAAGASGVVVALSSSFPGGANIPASITIPQGATSASVTVSSGTVATATSVTLMASYLGVSKTVSLTVNPAAVAAAVNAVSATPNSGAGASQTFQFVASDSIGSADLQTVWMWFTPSPSNSTNSCLLYYNHAANQINLQNDAASTWMSMTPGVAGTLQNSQCSLDVSAVSITPSGNNLTVSLPMTFKAAYAGNQQVWMYASAASANSGWQQRGTWTVTAAAPVTPGVSVISVTPNTGSGTTQTFQFVASDSNGSADLQSVWMWFTPSPSNSTNSCLLYYNPAANQINLMNDAGGTWMPMTPGAGGTLQNTQCSLNVGSVTVTASGNNLTVSLPMTFKAPYAGNQQVWMYASAAGANSGWQQRGTWTVTAAATGGAVSVVSVSPNTGSGLTQTFQFVASDSGGSADLQTMWMWFTASASSSTSSNCLFNYNQASNQINLLDDAGGTWMSMTAGAAGTLQNSQCSLNVGAMTIVPSGTNLAVSLPMSFKATYTGPKQLWMYAAGSAGNTGWQQRGSWTVQ